MIASIRNIFHKANRTDRQVKVRGLDREMIFQIENLEARQMLATMVDASTVTYQDVDGDAVTVKFSNPFLTAANVNNIFSFNTGSVNGSNATAQALNQIDLTGISAAAGTNIKTTVVRNNSSGGDGLATLGRIYAVGLDLGNVTIKGDLGQIQAGDSNTSTPGMRALKVHSLGRFGTTTGAIDLHSQIVGRVEALNVTTDIKDASFNVGGGADGKLGRVSVGGDIVGSSNNFSGLIYSDGDMGPVTIRGHLVGGGGHGSGQISSLGQIQRVTIGGSVVGGMGSDSGYIVSVGAMGTVKIKQNLRGANGSGSGGIYSYDRLVAVRIAGSVLGGSGMESGTIRSVGDLGSVRVSGDVTGSYGIESASISSFGRISKIAIGGSLTSGYAQKSGSISAGHDIGRISIRGSIAGTSFISHYKVAITAYGQSVASGTTDLAIGRLTVNGSVYLTEIIAGRDRFGLSNADAQIGSVVVRGDWIASDLVAGADAGADGHFGTSDDTKMNGGEIRDRAHVFSKINSIVIGGQVTGTAVAGDYFGFVAEEVGRLRIDGKSIALQSGRSNDNILLDPGFDDVRVREI